MGPGRPLSGAAVPARAPDGPALRRAGLPPRRRSHRQEHRLRCGGVTGISNLFGTVLPAGQLWASALQAVAALQPQLPVVGYGHGTGLAAARQAGCQVLGPLRVWACDPAP